jgi:Protein of unknown function (DUF3592)
MQIVEQSSDRLVMRQGAWGLRAAGIGFAVFGAGVLTALIWSGHAKDHGVWVAYVVCIAFVLAGIGTALTASDRQIVFDRARKLAQVIQRRGGGSQVTEIQFSEVRDIALESNPGLNRGASQAYRIVFVLRDGSRVPWTTLLTSDIGSQATCAAAARAFGGWDVAAARSGASPNEVARPTPTPGMMPILATPRGVPIAPSLVGPPTVPNVGCVLAFLGLIAAAGASGFVVEVQRLITWRPVPAVVMDSHVEAVRGAKGGTTYRPDITFAYRVDAVTYNSSTALLFPESRSREWAIAISTRYRPGKPTTAYVDPRNPARVYLVHEFSMLPLIFVLIPLIFAGVVSLSMRWQRQQLAVAAGLTVPILAPRSAIQPRAA